MPKLKRILCSLACLGFFTLLSACLPGENELAQEAEFNQQTQINNTAYSLYQTANSMAGYLTGESRRRKAPLSETPITQLATTENNVEPKAPEGIKVIKCETGMLGAMVYFTQNPKGIPPLRISGAAMARKLAERHDERYLGWYENGRVTLPKLAEEKGCTDTNGIVEGSPIFLSGFAYGSDDGNPIVLPDPEKVTWPTVGKAVTLPCPSGFSGSITRGQDCRLITDEQGGETEDITFRTGVVEMGDVQSPGYELKAVRKKKRWECDPAQDKSVPPTAEEILKFCRNDADNMTKPNDNIVTMTAESFKQILEGSGPGYYTYSCRQNADGSNKCDAAPYTPTLPETTLRCDRNPVPERYVINPKLPIEVDYAGNVVTETPEAATTGAITAARDCGNGWTGDLIAGYEVRACQLVKKVDGVETPLQQAQTIYKIGYVGARCKTPPLETTYNCPWPLGGNMVLREEHSMTKPLALQLQTAARGEWSKSAIPYIGNINLEAEQRAKDQDYIISNVSLAGRINPDFTNYLIGAMGLAMQKDITGCKLAGQTCEFLPDPIKLGIVFDRSDSMDWEKLGSVSQRMECKAEIRDIFSSGMRPVACSLLALGVRDIKILERLLGDRSNPIVMTLLKDAIDNRRTCSEMTTDKVGYCTPGRGSNQSTCSPGRCETVNVDLNNETRLVVAEEQLLVALGYVPPGSQLRYTEYYDDNVSFIPFPKFCDPMEDDTCDFGAEIARAKERVAANKGNHKGSTPLLNATASALGQFGNLNDGSEEKGILIFFSDGSETDYDGSFRSTSSYPFTTFCKDQSPSYDPEDTGGFCRYIGLYEGIDVDQAEPDITLMLAELYARHDCANNPDLHICTSVLNLYDGAKFIKAGANTCSGVGVTKHPTAVEYIQNKFPNLKVFILDMGGDLNACPSDPNGQIVKISMLDRGSFEDAFSRAFASLNTRAATPEFVCQRVRDRLYSGAVNY